MKRLSILGSTGSVGRNTLKVVSEYKDSFSITCLAAGSNTELLKEQAKIFKPEFLSVFDKEKALLLQRELPSMRVVGGMEGLLEAATSGDLIVFAMSGSIGLKPLSSAIKAKKTIALANKEALVAGGEIITSLVKEHGVLLLPLDSEHSAIFQCLKNEKEIKRLILTASGGPFLELPKERFPFITIEDALKHPTYSMGKKNSIDSSTLMNKGLEVIEAYYLFGKENIEVVIHPESIVHSFVEFIDGSILAQLSEPDMCLPIQVALFYPERKASSRSLDLTKKPLRFFPVDSKKFPCLSLAYEALRVKKSLPCFMNAANEVLVQRFLNKEIAWVDIAAKLEQLMSLHTPQNVVNLGNIELIEQEARQRAYGI